MRIVIQADIAAREGPGIEVPRAQYTTQPRVPGSCAREPHAIIAITIIAVERFKEILGPGEGSETVDSDQIRGVEVTIA